MEDDQKQNPTGAMCGLVINGIFAYFFYKYAFLNPDEGSCFAKDGNETAYGEVPMIRIGDGGSSSQQQ